MWIMVYICHGKDKNIYYGGYILIKNVSKYFKSYEEIKMPNIFYVILAYITNKTMYGMLYIGMQKQSIF